VFDLLAQRLVNVIGSGEERVNVCAEPLLGFFVGLEPRQLGGRLRCNVKQGDHFIFSLLQSLQYAHLEKGRSRLIDEPIEVSFLWPHQLGWQLSLFLLLSL